MVFNWIGSLFGSNNKSSPARKPSSTSVVNKPGAIPFAPLANQADRDRAARSGTTSSAPLNSVVRRPGWIPDSPLESTKASIPTRAPAASGGGGGGGGVGYSLFGGGGGGVAATPETPPRLSDDDWLAKDTAYQASLASLANRLKSFETENTAQRERSIQDYGQALSRLGWDQEGETWNQDDRTTAFGNSFQNLLNDFASRGMLQSTLYDQARTDLQSNFGRQRDEMGTAHTNALEELARALSGFQTETQQSRDQARMEALARRASLEMGG